MTDKLLPKIDTWAWLEDIIRTLGGNAVWARVCASAMAVIRAADVDNNGAIDINCHCSECNLVRAIKALKACRPESGGECKHPFIIIDRCRDCGAFVGPQP